MLFRSLHISFVCKVPEKEAGPLTGVVICVGKKLSKMQSELNAIAASLGADFRYSAHPYWLPKTPLLSVSEEGSNCPHSVEKYIPQPHFPPSGGTTLKFPNRSTVTLEDVHLISDC